MYVDSDSDGFGDDDNTMEGSDCNAVNGYSFVPGDCDDNDAMKNRLDADGDGLTSCDNTPDCNDNNADISPLAFDICNDGIDQNCDGTDNTVCQVYEGEIIINSSEDADYFCSLGYSAADMVVLNSGTYGQDIDLRCLQSVGTFAFGGYEYNVSPNSVNLSNLQSATEIYFIFGFGSEWNVQSIDLSLLSKMSKICILAGRGGGGGGEVSWVSGSALLLDAPSIDNIQMDEVYNWGSEWPFANASIDYLEIHNFDYEGLDTCSMVENVQEYWLDFYGWWNDAESTNEMWLDPDGDGYECDSDCDSSDWRVHAEASEVCDGVDNDCDGLVDSDDDSLSMNEEGFAAYYDGDGDGNAGSYEQEWLRIVQLQPSRRIYL